MTEIFPANLRELWNSLELRVLVLFSLFLQVVLTATGNRRKYTRRKSVALIVWLAYLSADAVATLALGILSQNTQTDSTYVLMSLWGPFLLIHLGGPDTITAYALADNQLWSRHMLALIGQVTIAVYVFLRSFVNSPLNYLWFLVFLSGLLKYGERRDGIPCTLEHLARCTQMSSHLRRFGGLEGPSKGGLVSKGLVSGGLISRAANNIRVHLARCSRVHGIICRERTLVLFLASRDHFRKSLVSDPDPGPNYAKFMDEWVSREAEGYIVHPGKAFVTTSSTMTRLPRGVESDDPDVVLQEAFYFYKTFKRLFADLILSFEDREMSSSFFTNLTWNKAFHIVEVELGLVYDLFYTKAFSLDSVLGFFLRLFTCSSSVAACIAFRIIDKSTYPKNEVIITYFLFFDVITLEIYAFVIILSSDRMMIRLIEDWSYMYPIGLRKLKGSIVVFVRKIVSILHYLHLVPEKRGGPMKQDNTIS